MITRAIIKKIYGNHCSIAIPLFSNDISNSPIEVNGAVMMIPPGMLGQYEVGDTVIIDFEEYNFSKPIILGKLYTGGENKPQAAEVLSLGTKISPKSETMGTATVSTPQSIAEVLQDIADLNIRLSKLEGLVTEINSTAD